MQLFSVIKKATITITENVNDGISFVYLDLTLFRDTFLVTLTHHRGHSNTGPEITNIISDSILGWLLFSEGC